MRAFSALIADLSSALARPLPAAAAHLLMSPRPRRSWPEGPNRVRDAAGLLLLFPHAGRAHIVLTVRAETLGDLQRQLSGLSQTERKRPVRGGRRHRRR